MSGVSKVSLRSLLIIAAGMALLIFVAITVLASNYSSAFGGDPTKKRAVGVYRFAGLYFFDTNYIMPSGELGRFTTLFFWLQHNELFGPRRHAVWLRP